MKYLGERRQLPQIFPEMILKKASTSNTIRSTRIGGILFAVLIIYEDRNCENVSH